MLHSPKYSDQLRQNLLEETRDCRGAMETALVRKSQDVVIERISVGKLGTCSADRDAESLW